MDVDVSDVEYKIQERMEQLEVEALEHPVARIALEELKDLQAWIIEGANY